jgi:hypothetical protein
MRLIKKQLSLWRIVLIIGVAAIGLPIAARVGPKHSRPSKAAVGVGTALLQDDDYYDRRREYWEKRIERDLDDEEGDDDNDEDNKATKDSKKAADNEDDENDDVEREIERRREYWQKRLDRDW